LYRIKIDVEVRQGDANLSSDSPPLDDAPGTSTEEPGPTVGDE